MKLMTTLALIGASVFTTALAQDLAFSRIGIAPWVEAASDRVSLQGNPLSLNQLHAYRGKVYFGYGDTSLNVGPIEIGYYDPDQHEFVTEFLLGSEIIERFKVFDGALYVPSSDPAHFFNQADYAFCGTDGLWKRSDRLGMLHTTDMAWFNERLIVSGSAGLALDNNTQRLILSQSSSDLGQSWSPLQINLDAAPSAGRYYYVIPFQDQAYFFGKVIDPLTCGDDCLPAISGLDARVQDYVSFANQLVYTTRSGKLKAFDGTKSVDLRDALDLQVADGALYILTSEPSLEVTHDLQTWQPISTTDLPKNARSLVRLDQHWFLGTEDGHLWCSRNPTDAPPKVRRFRGDSYGQAIVSFESSIAVGIPAVGDQPWNHGEVHFYPSESDVPQILLAPNRLPLGYFGTHVALTETWMAVAESQRGFEQVHLFHRDDKASPWQWQQEVAGPPVSSLALQDEILVIGYQFESNAPGPEVFRVYQLNDQAWELGFRERASALSAAIDNYSTFLSQVALSDETLLLGVVGDAGDNQAQGAAFLYQKSSDAPSWKRTATIEQVEPKSGFGTDVALNERWIAIGAPRTKRSDLQSGAVYIYERTSPLSESAPTFTLDPPSPEVSHFGRTIALNGNRMLIGAPNQHWKSSTSGAVYVIDLDSQEIPTIVSKIEPSLPGTRGFGNALSYQQDRLLIGSEQIPFPQNDLAVQITMLNASSDQDFDRLPDAWEEEHFGNLQSGPQEDPDKDHRTNLQEFLSGTNPTLGDSQLVRVSIVRRDTEIILSWPALPNARYTILGSNGLTASRWEKIESVMPQDDTISVTLPKKDDQQFFRVLVH